MFFLVLGSTEANEKRVAQIRKDKETKKRLFTVLGDVGVYSLYVMLLMTICMDIRDERTYMQNLSLQKELYPSWGNVVRRFILYL